MLIGVMYLQDFIFSTTLPSRHYVYFKEEEMEGLMNDLS